MSPTAIYSYKKVGTPGILYPVHSRTSPVHAPLNLPTSIFRVNLDENFEFNCPQWAKLGAASPGDADRRWKWDDEHASQERPSLRKPNARARVPKPLLSTADIEDARRIRIARESNTAPSSPPKRPMPQSCEPLVCDVEPWWKSLETEDPDVTSVLRS